MPAGPPPAPLRGAIVGLGNVAVHGHLPGWRGRPDARIVAVADTRAARREVAARELPGARWYDAVQALLAQEPLDFVDVCTPPASHAGLVRAALERGLAVLCEKPLVTAAADLPPLRELARAKGLALFTVHNWHHAPIVRRATELIRAGAVGRVERVSWRTHRQRPAATSDGADGNWRVDPAVAGGGVLTDHGWHVFYVLRRWLGADPVAVSARLETRRHRQFPVEDTATVTLRFPQATAEVFLSWAADERLTRAEIHGAAGVLRVEDDTLVLARDGAEERWACPPALSDGSHHPDRFDAVAAEVLAGVRGRPCGPGPSGNPDGAPGDNLAEAALCVAIEARARESSHSDGALLPFRAPEPPPSPAG
jgi:predicted dehydrogenase